MRLLSLNRSEVTQRVKNEVPRLGVCSSRHAESHDCTLFPAGNIYFMVAGTAAIIAGSGHFCLPLLEDKIVFGLNWDSQSENLHPGPTNALSSG